MTKEELQSFFEDKGFHVHLFEQDEQVRAEVEKWTDLGVDMIATLMPFTKESFLEYIKDFDVDDEIASHRHDKLYRDNFTIRQSIKDFSDFYAELKVVASELMDDKTTAKKLKIKNHIIDMLEQSHGAMVKKIDSVLKSGAIDIDSWDEKDGPMIIPKCIVKALMEHESLQYEARNTGYERKIKKEVRKIRYYIPS